MKNYAIILASGTGERSGLEIPKQFIKIGGKTVLEHTIKVFQNSGSIDEIIVVTHENYIDSVKTIAQNYDKVSLIIRGGKTRRESSFIGLNAIKDENAKVLIHDAVRPFISSKIIDECILALNKYKAVDVAITSADTIIKVDSENLIEDIPKRSLLRRGQTPQGFDLKTIKKAHELANQCNDLSVTDDCGLILKFNLCDVYVVNGDEFNIKITYPIDVAIADKLFQIKTSEISSLDFNNLKDKVIAVFGGYSGIGESIVENAKNIGAKLYPFSRRNGADVSQLSEVKHALESVYQKENRIDYIINTAGILNYGEIINRDIDDIKQEIETNYIGCINIAKASFEYLTKSKGGLLFFASSSYTRGRKNYAVYSSAKSAVVNFTQALAEEWEEYGIRVNAIVPERTATPMRYKNFGNEPKDSLLAPDIPAKMALATIISDLSGQVINVNRSQLSIEDV